MLGESKVLSCFWCLLIKGIGGWGGRGTCVTPGVREVSLSLIAREVVEFSAWGVFVDD